MFSLIVRIYICINKIIKLKKNQRVLKNGIQESFSRRFRLPSIRHSFNEFESTIRLIFFHASTNTREGLNDPIRCLSPQLALIPRGRTLSAVLCGVSRHHRRTVQVSDIFTAYRSNHKTRYKSHARHDTPHYVRA